MNVKENDFADLPKAISGLVDLAESTGSDTTSLVVSDESMLLYIQNEPGAVVAVMKAIKAYEKREAKKAEPGSNVKMRLKKGTNPLADVTLDE